MLADMRFLLAATLLCLIGCDRPTEDECRKAVYNLQKLRGLEADPGAPDPEAAIRRCRASGKRESAQCLGDAKTLEEANACIPAAAK
jgi:hypothetical protein